MKNYTNYLSRDKKHVEYRLAKEIKKELEIRGTTSKVGKKLLGFFAQNKLNICEYQKANRFTLHQVLKAEKLETTDLMVLFSDEIFAENISSLKADENIETFMFQTLKRLYS